MTEIKIPAKWRIRRPSSRPKAARWATFVSRSGNVTLDPTFAARAPNVVRTFDQCMPCIAPRAAQRFTPAFRPGSPRTATPCATDYESRQKRQPRSPKS